ncbi:falz-related bromodomain-containing protein [Anaeramoeba flamelloides]|uniref:Falz-related bromodomain-containing protein n=1 Tax=Anaeramoeba flamelloides TaxID=1746091 RepID=A0ABQ8YN70_9EUKA|nr:falz-related bromodomain-containing protein [Anaeramoeba flamelloides]
MNSPTQSILNEKLVGETLNKVKSMLKFLQEHEYGWLFAYPVDPVSLCIPTYFQVIKHPMDLSTIESKLNNNQYLNLQGIVDDFRLIFNNSIVFNAPDTFVAKCSILMKNEMEQKFALWGIPPPTSRVIKTEGNQVYSNENFQTVPVQNNPEEIVPFVKEGNTLKTENQFEEKQEEKDQEVQQLEQEKEKENEKIQNQKEN